MGSRKIYMYIKKGYKASPEGKENNEKEQEQDE